MLCCRCTWYPLSAPYCDVSSGHEGLGLLTLPPNLIFRNPIAIAISIHILHQPAPALNASGAWGLSGPVSPEVTQLCALVGVFSCAISMAYAISLPWLGRVDLYVHPWQTGCCRVGIDGLGFESAPHESVALQHHGLDGSVALITGWTLGTWSRRRSELVAGRTTKND